METKKCWSSRRSLKTGLRLWDFLFPPLTSRISCGATPLIESYALNITTPIKNAVLYIDPEMPPEYSTISLNCAVKPQSSAVLWEINGEEYKIAEYPYKVSWNLIPGTFTFRARIPGTPIVSGPVTIEFY